MKHVCMREHWFSKVLACLLIVTFGVQFVNSTAANLFQYPPDPPRARAWGSPLVAMPKEYINYTITPVDGSLWAKVDGKYPLHKIFGARDVFELDGLEYYVLSDELPMVYPTPPGTTNISVKMNETELNWSNYTEARPEATHYTAIGDWPMIYCEIDHIPDYFILTIHYEHPLNIVNGSYTFLYDLNISPYLSPWSNKSTAYFSIRMETNYTNLNVYTVRSNGTRNPINYTITKENTAETITLKIVSEYSKPLLGDLVISFTTPKTPESTNPAFFGTSLPTEYGYAIVATAIAAIAILISLFLKRKKLGE